MSAMLLGAAQGTFRGIGNGTSAPTTRIVGILGSLFALLGLVTFLLPESLQNLALGSGFDGLPLAFGMPGT